MLEDEVSDNAAARTSDIRRGDWVDQWLPATVRPYVRLARLDRPIGIWLLMFPCWWSVALASESWPNPGLLVLFALGSALMRGAGCTYNDLADRKFDAMVTRTASRPLPSGTITPLRAVGFMIALSLAALLVLLQFNVFSVILGASSLLVVAIYPFAKRITDWPQAVLGLAFNWGALLGWSAVHGNLQLPALLLYLGGIFWTLGYDTIYAHQDKEDDILIGVRSTALRLGPSSRHFILLCYLTAMAAIAAAVLIRANGWMALLLLPAFGHLFWQVISVDFDDARDCLAKFKSNQFVGLWVFVAIAAAHVAW